MAGRKPRPESAVYCWRARAQKSLISRVGPIGLIQARTLTSLSSTPSRQHPTYQLEDEDENESLTATEIFALPVVGLFPTDTADD
jgi:hypothetical protein